MGPSPLPALVFAILTTLVVAGVSLVAVIDTRQKVNGAVKAFFVGLGAVAAFFSIVSDRAVVPALASGIAGGVLLGVGVGLAPTGIVRALRHERA